MILNGPPDIGNRIVGQGINVFPIDVVAFVGFIIERLTAPGKHMEEEIHAFIAIIAMHHTRKENVFLFDLHAHLFRRFARGGRPDSLIPIQMPGWNAVLAVTITCIEPTR